MLLIQSILIRLFERLLCHVGMNTLLTLDRGDHCSDYCDIVHILITISNNQFLFSLQENYRKNHVNLITSNLQHVLYLSALGP